MSWIYTQQDYGVGSFAGNGIVDDDYTKYIGAKREARGPLYHASWNSLTGAKILLAGCGFGEMVQEMTDRGFTDVWGCDASAAGILEGQTRFPAIASRLLVGDVLNTGSLSVVRTAAGLRGNQRFRLVVSENVLPCMANVAEVQTALTNMRAISQSLAHLISVVPDDELTSGRHYRHADGSIRYAGTDAELRMPGFLWETAQWWIDQIATPSEWIFTASLERVQ